MPGAVQFVLLQLQYGPSFGSIAGNERTILIIKYRWLDFEETS